MEKDSDKLKFRKRLGKQEKDSEKQENDSDNSKEKDSEKQEKKLRKGPKKQKHRTFNFVLRIIKDDFWYSKKLFLCK